MRGDERDERFLISTALVSERAASEDRLLVERVPAGLLVVVADGAGGMSGGARAASVLVQRVKASVVAAPPNDDLSKALCATLREMDSEISSDPKAGETTAIVLVVTTDRIVGASVGDSEAWVASDDGCDVLTGEQRRRRIGNGDAAPVSFTRSFMEGSLVVGTDGLFAYAKPEAVCRIARIATPTEDAASRLIDLVRLPEGRFPDDASVVVVRRV